MLVPPPETGTVAAYSTTLLSRWHVPAPPVLFAAAALGESHHDLVETLELRRKMAVSDVPVSYRILVMHRGLSPTMLVAAMTRHDFEAWLDHHLDQAVLVEWRELDGGLVKDTTSMTGALHRDGDGEYHAGEAHIDLGDFEAADFGGDGVIVELAQGSAELYIAVS